MQYNKKKLAWLFIGLLIYILFGMFFTSCKVSKKIDKSVFKNDSSSFKQSFIDSTEISFDVSETENTTHTSLENESRWEPHQVDSGEGIIIGRNGTAEDYIEILPANNKRKLFLPKNTKVENTKSTTTETKTEAKAVEVERKAAEGVAVKHEENQVHKDTNRSSWGWSLGILIPLLFIIYTTAAYWRGWPPFRKNRHEKLLSRTSDTTV